MKTAKKWFWPLLFCLSAVIVASIHLAMQGHTLLDIYPPNGTERSSIWNDEVAYYQQVKAILQYGIPQGWYAVNGTHARYLTLYAWSPLIYLPYVVLAKLWGGWNFYSPYICNALFFTIALVIFYFWVRPDKWQVLRFALLLFLFPSGVNYIFSGMTEAMFCAFCVIMYAAHYKMDRDNYGYGFLIFVYALISYIVMIRPYYLPFYFIPFWYWRKRDFKKSLAVTGIVAGVSTAGHFLICHYLCCTPLIESNLSSAITADASIPDIFLNYLSRFFTTWLRILRDMGGETYKPNVILFTLLVAFISLWAAKEYFTAKKVSFSPIFSISIYLLILSLFCLMGNFQYPRHVVPLTMWMICVLTMEMPPKFFAVVSAALLCCYVVFYPNTAYPYGNAADRQADRQIMENLASKMELVDGISWDNTVSWVIYPYRALYYLPAGFGIDVEEDSDIQALPPSRYVLAVRGGNIDAQLAGNSKVLYSDESSVLYERR